MLQKCTHFFLIPRTMPKRDSLSFSHPNWKHCLVNNGTQCRSLACIHCFKWVSTPQLSLLLSDAVPLHCTTEPIEHYLFLFSSGRDFIFCGIEENQIQAIRYAIFGFRFFAIFFWRCYIKSVIISLISNLQPTHSAR